MSTRVKVNMKPVNRIVTRLGLNKTGDVQMQATRIINQRITRYMPYRTGALATKLKFIKSPTEIEVLGPYARYQYYGEVMVDPETRAADFKDKDGQWKSRRGVPKVRSGRPIQYTKTKHPLAGPFWDRRLMAAEGAQIAKELQNYVDRKAGKR